MEELPIIQKTYDLIKWYVPILNRLPKTHKFILGDSANRLENFTRVETFGNNAANDNNDVNWVKVTVKPLSREVFSYQPQIVPNNRVALPSP
ncbi:hypothetical protein [Scytonema sp. NUACC26]|uniref:hypothetical protein n=1 Tax=Scytonema sp. NUACC26 TaxID=3140176 RepID=UPI0034DC384A